MQGIAFVRLFKPIPLLDVQGLRLGHRSLFIFPEFRGVAYGVMAVVMILGALNFAINPALIIACLFTSILLVTLTHTHRNLLGLMIEPVRFPEVFAGDPVPIALLLREVDSRPRWAIGLKSERGMQTAPSLDLGANQRGMLTLDLPPQGRGPCTIGLLTLFSRYPLGLIRAWTHVAMAEALIVYPRPEALHADHLPISVPWQGRREPGPGAGGDDFIGLEGWRPGDSFGTIHWKASMQHATMLAKRFGGDSHQKIMPDKTWLCWEDAKLPEVEARLSRLCRWVLDADARHRPYGLKLPGLTLAPGTGSAHRRRCLEALAMFHQP